VAVVKRMVSCWAQVVSTTENSLLEGKPTPFLDDVKKEILQIKLAITLLQNDHSLSPIIEQIKSDVVHVLNSAVMVFGIYGLNMLIV